jgi:hypothetical protein
MEIKVYLNLFCLVWERSGYVPVHIVTDPDPEGPKTEGSKSVTLLLGGPYGRPILEDPVGVQLFRVRFYLGPTSTSISAWSGSMRETKERSSQPVHISLISISPSHLLPLLPFPSPLLPLPLPPPQNSGPEIGT